jgi:hygromycin-B 7''-O-kinase
MTLPTGISVQDFDALHDEPGAWHGDIAALAHQLQLPQPLVQMEEGTALVAVLGGDGPAPKQVLKLYPPFLHDHFLFERAALRQVQGQLSLPTPALLASGDHGGWPYLVISFLPGVPLVQRWSGLPEATRCQVLRQIGQVAAQVQRLPVGDLAALAPDWPQFMQRQRAGCHGRQQRTGLPAHLLQQLEQFLNGPVPTGDPVILTGEYTPMNLMFDDSTGTLCGMFDFGDGLVGPPAYDWLGPLAFLAAGNAQRCQAFMSGLGQVLDPALRLALLRLLLLHRYSNLKAQLALPGWQGCASFEDLAEALWPLSGPLASGPELGPVTVH